MCWPEDKLEVFGGLRQDSDSVLEGVGSSLQRRDNEQGECALLAQKIPREGWPYSSHRSHQKQPTQDPKQLLTRCSKCQPPRTMEEKLCAMNWSSSTRQQSLSLVCWLMNRKGCEPKLPKTIWRDLREIPIFWISWSAGMKHQSTSWIQSLNLSHLCGYQWVQSILSKHWEAFW